MNLGNNPKRAHGWLQEPVARSTRLKLQWKKLQVTDAETAQAFDAFIAAIDSESKKSGSPWTALTGVRVERVWTSLHAAEVMLVENAKASLLKELHPWLSDEVQTNLSTASRQRRAIVALKREDLTDHHCHELALALQTAHASSAAQHRRVRSFRNTMYGVALGLVAVVVILAVAAAVRPTALPMCTPDGKTEVCVFSGSTTPEGTQVLFVALVGAAAGILSGIPSLRRIKGTSTPYSVPTALWMLKAPGGALSAILGLLFLRGELINDLAASSSGALMAWAIVFGTSQQLLTRLADNQAQKVLDGVRSGTGKAAKEEDA